MTANSRSRKRPHPSYDTYLTRNDRANAFPSSVNSIMATDEMIFTLRSEFYNAEVQLAAYNGLRSFTYDTDNCVLIMTTAASAYYLTFFYDRNLLLDETGGSNHVGNLYHAAFLRVPQISSS